MKTKLLLPIVMFCVCIAIASADIFLCSPSADCIMYETVYNGGNLCTDCNVSITIYNPNSSINQIGNFTHIISGQYRYNAGVLSSGYYDTVIQGINASGGTAFSEITLIQSSGSNTILQNLTHQSIVPQIDQYITLPIFIFLICFAIAFIVVGYYIDFYPCQVLGFFILFICSVILISGNLVQIVSDSFIPFNIWIAKSIGFSLMLLSVIGAFHIWYEIKRGRATEE